MFLYFIFQTMTKQVWVTNKTIKEKGDEHEGVRESVQGVGEYLHAVAEYVNEAEGMTIHSKMLTDVVIY